MGGFNLSFFNFLHGLSGRNFFVDAAGIFAAEYVSYVIFLAFLWLVISQTGLPAQTGWRQKIFFFSEAAIAVILSRGLITEIVRFFYYSPRPFEALHFQSLIPESGSSIPSGHAAFFFALATIIYFYNRRWGIWYFVLSLLIGLARIFAGVHWPSDIIAGVVVGILSGLFVHALLKNYLQKLKEPPPATISDES
ncbi:MAG: phosphatase PAP2 family protein [Candidatus Liptonbacteria bacterium]|nr:phosphatase PAP2 family protein [Candidatus Liptonbacteria bacterium]